MLLFCFQEELEHFCAKNPDYVCPKLKSCLLASEQSIKDRAEGKPEIPPKYLIFLKIYLGQCSLTGGLRDGSGPQSSLIRLAEWFDPVRQRILKTRK